MKLSDIESIFKSLVWDSAVKAGLAALYADPYTSWLNVWPLNAIVNAIAVQITNYAYSGIIYLVDISAIELRDNEHQKEYINASVNLQIIAHDKGIESQEFKDAREKAKMALSKFSQFYH